jgi:hypothetical protein
MASIYANAEVTIAATLASDTSAGCFAKRTPKKYVSIDYTSPEGTRGKLLASLQPLFHETEESMYLGMNENPLVGRAWAMQERLISRRILHFEKYQMYFECSHGFRGESGLSIGERHLGLPNLDESDEKVDDEDEVMSGWYSLVARYGSLTLTYSSDKLPALAGIAKIYGTKLQDQYLAGLWRKTLVKDLYWTVQNPRRLSYYRAPSWSWVSLDGIPDVGFLSRILGGVKVLPEVIDCEMELKGSNPYGEVTGGKIKLQAPLEPLFLTGQFIRPYERYSNLYLMVRTERGNPSGCEADFDFEFGVEVTLDDGSTALKCPEDVKMFALILAEGLGAQPTEQGEDRYGYYCLIVYSGDDSLVMRRLGLVWMGTEAMGECKWQDPSVKRPIVTLV